MFEWLVTSVLRLGVGRVTSALPDVENPEVDPNHPDSVLFAAAIYDKQGEWEQSIELFEWAAARWPEEHGEYARNSIAEIRAKMDASS